MWNYSVTNEGGRVENFERIYREIKPVDLLLQEVADEESVFKPVVAYRNAFVEELGGVEFTDGNDTDKMLFYNGAKFV